MGSPFSVSHLVLGLPSIMFLGAWSSFTEKSAVAEEMSIGAGLLFLPSDSRAAVNSDTWKLPLVG